MTTLPRRPLLLGLAVAGTAALVGVGSLTVLTRAATDVLPRVTALEPGARVGQPAPGSTPTASSPAPRDRSTMAPSGAGSAQSSGLAQVVALATQRADGRVEKVEVKYGPSRPWYKVDLTRRDGIEVEVTVVGRTARVTGQDRDRDSGRTQPRAAPALTLPGAAALAVKAGRGRLDTVKVHDGPRGPYYEVDLTRADGNDVEVTVVGRTARVTDEDRDT